jgi:membrane protease subunit (stomatin/prohibitin family)
MGFRRARRRGIVAGAVVASSVNNRRRANEAEAQAVQPVAEPTQAAPQDDLTAQLEQLNNLKNQGILTQDEFDAKKKQILGI